MFVGVNALNGSVLSICRWLSSRMRRRVYMAEDVKFPLFSPSSSYHTNAVKECPVGDQLISSSVAFATSLLMRQFKGMCCTPLSFPRTHGESSLGDLCRIEERLRLVYVGGDRGGSSGVVLVGACCCHNEIVKEASFERNCLFPPTFPTILPA